MKKLLLSASALLFALSLTACGGDDKAAEENAATDDKASTASSETAAPATKPEAEAVKTEEAKPTTTPNTPPEAAAPSTPPAAPSAPPAPTTTPEATAPSAAPAATTAAIDGEKVYKGLCFSCHVAGVAGAPKLDDKAAWAPRLATGIDALYATSLNGKGAMPAKGGNPALSDAEVKAAVDYMVKQVQ